MRKINYETCVPLIQARRRKRSLKHSLMASRCYQNNFCNDTSNIEIIKNSLRHHNCLFLLVTKSFSISEVEARCNLWKTSWVSNGWSNSPITQNLDFASILFPRCRMTNYKERQFRGNVCSLFITWKSALRLLLR